MLLASLAAAAPIARWCPLRWDQVDLRAYFECASLPRTVIPVSCPTAEECARHAEHTVAPACVAETGACGARTECPLRIHRGDHLATAETPASLPASAPRRSPGRAYCLDAPGMSTAMRSDAPAPDAPLAIAAFIVSIDVPASFRPIAPVADARPPTRAPAARPPIRGPPFLLG